VFLSEQDALDEVEVWFSIQRKGAKKVEEVQQVGRFVLHSSFFFSWAFACPFVRLSRACLGK
jgi:hypothetical protein